MFSKGGSRGLVIGWGSLEGTPFIRPVNPIQAPRPWASRSTPSQRWQTDTALAVRFAPDAAIPDAGSAGPDPPARDSDWNTGSSRRLPRSAGSDRSKPGQPPDPRTTAIQIAPINQGPGLVEHSNPRIEYGFSCRCDDVPVIQFKRELINTPCRENSKAGHLDTIVNSNSTNTSWTVDL